MKRIFAFALLLRSAGLFAQSPCQDGTIIINGSATDAVFIENENKTGLNLPLWLSSGTTLAAGTRVHFISVIEFNVIIEGGNSNLSFNRVLQVGTQSETVPTDKVWKVEAIVKHANALASGITASSNSPVCQGQQLNLSASNASGATYQWTGPNGFTSTDQNPIISNVGTAHAGTYSVIATVNGCTSPASTTVVSVLEPPVIQGTISGGSTSASNAVLTYSITPIDGVTQYDWTIPAGWSLNSGQGTPSVSLTTGANSGTISVSATNSCGASNPVTLNVTISNFKKVFVTSGTWNGNLGGLAGADSKCQTAASSAGLSGTFKAWLSTGSEPAATRLSQSAAPYALVNGTVIALNWADLTDGSLQNPINRNEFGNTVGSPEFAHSYSSISGQPYDGTGGSPFYCNLWSNATTSNYTRYGNINSTDANWTDTNWAYCNVAYRLYCFEQ